MLAVGPIILFPSQDLSIRAVISELPGVYGVFLF